MPGGDAVQRVWSVADGGGLTLVEVGNDSPLPIACALTRGDLLTARPPADVPVEGIELPAGTIVLPIGHRASVTVALAHEHPAGGPLPRGSATPEATARGWVARSERASRVVLPDERAADRLVAARADLLLTGPAAGGRRPGRVPAGTARARPARRARRHAPSTTSCPTSRPRCTRRRAATAGTSTPRSPPRPRCSTWRGEDRAARDLARLRAPRAAVAPGPDAAADGVRGVAAVERHLAADGVLLPGRHPGRVARRQTSRPTACRSARRRRCRSPCAGTASTPPCCGRRRRARRARRPGCRRDVAHRRGER